MPGQQGTRQISPGILGGSHENGTQNGGKGAPAGVLRDVEQALTGMALRNLRRQQPVRIGQGHSAYLIS